MPCLMSGAGLWIRIRMFLDLLDPDPSLFVRIQIIPSPSKNSKKNRDLLKSDVNVPSKSNKQKNLEMPLKKVITKKTTKNVKNVNTQNLHSFFFIYNYFRSHFSKMTLTY
jgi:hypothetical protein